MKKVLVSLFLALGLAVTAQANTGGIAWDKAPNKSSDLASLQNGAKVFVNYCLNCHSAAFMRFNRLCGLRSRMFLRPGHIQSTAQNEQHHRNKQTFTNLTWHIVKMRA